MLPASIRKLIDWALTLLPGAKSDPSSLESRVRKVTEATIIMVELAIAEEAAVRAAVKADAEKAAEAARAVEASAKARAVALEAIVKTV